jgi:hypothetical protein
MVAAPTPLRETVFINHGAPEDNEFALWLSAKLAIAGYRVWVDRRRLRGGDDFWDEIDRVLRTEAIKQIVIFSEHIGKLNCENEPYYARGCVLQPSCSTGFTDNLFNVDGHCHALAMLPANAQASAALPPR